MHRLSLWRCKEYFRILKTLLSYQEQALLKTTLSSFRQNSKRGKPIMRDSQIGECAQGTLLAPYSHRFTSCNQPLSQETIGDDQPPRITTRLRVHLGRNIVSRAQAAPAATCIGGYPSRCNYHTDSMLATHAHTESYTHKLSIHNRCQ